MAQPNEDYKETVDGTGNSSTDVDLGNKYAVGNENVINERPDAPGMADTKSTTGSGLEAALGTGGYSWEKNATDRANLSYQSDVLTAKQNYLQQRQNIEQQGQQMQTQYDMEQYNRNQSAEKVGWTGGYALDEKRQMDYLKATIQSQMYGSMELQKYGYDTSLAAARLAYDTNKYDLALEYYNTALSRAVTEAELTGVYISPEANEMKSQYFAAEEKLKENPNDENAQRVKAATKQWFESNNISENGIYTFNALIELNTLYEAMWDKLDSTYKDTDLYQMDADTFINVNATQQDIALNGFAPYKINFKPMSGADIIEYIQSDPTGRAAEQYLSTLDSAGDTITQNIVDKLKEDKIIFSVIEGTGENATEKVSSNLSKEDIKAKVLSYFKANTGVLKDTLQESLNKFNEEEQEIINKYLNNYYYDIDLPGDLGTLHITINTETNKTSLTEAAAKQESTTTPDTTPDTSPDYLDTLANKEELFEQINNIDYSKILKGNSLENIKAADDQSKVVFKEKTFKALKEIKDDWEDYFGDQNLEYIKQLDKEYSKMSEREKEKLPEDTKNRYEKIHKINEFTTTINEVYTELELYTTSGDSGSERAAEHWERFGDVYEDLWDSDATGGEKVAGTIVWTIGGGLYAIGGSIIEGIKWFF